MKSRFSDEQIIGMIKEYETGASSKGCNEFFHAAKKPILFLFLQDTLGAKMSRVVSAIYKYTIKTNTYLGLRVDLANQPLHAHLKK